MRPKVEVELALNLLEDSLATILKSASTESAERTGSPKTSLRRNIRVSARLNWPFMRFDSRKSFTLRAGGVRTHP
jgi:hypothetical protein